MADHESREERTEAARFASTASRAVWAKHQPRGSGQALSSFRRRLELFVAALFPGAPPIVAAEQPEPVPLLTRLTGRADPGRPTTAAATTDGARLQLPPTVRAEPEPAAARYRLLALEQAARAHRGTPLHLPEDDRLVRDLYCLAEAAAVDRTILDVAPGLRDDLTAARTDALAERRTLRLTAQERAVEEMTVGLLRSEPTGVAAEIPAAESPTESLGWARQAATRIRALPGTYRGVAPVGLWGVPSRAALVAESLAADENARAAAPPRQTSDPQPRSRSRSLNEGDTPSGAVVAHEGESQDRVEDAAGAETPAQGEPDDRGEAPATSGEIYETRAIPVTRTEERDREVPTGETPAPAVTSGRASTDRTAIVYPEWDFRVARYRQDGTIVRDGGETRSDPAWVDGALARQGPVIRRVRREFERLRPRRERLHHQRDGGDIDVDAWVTAAADLAAGTSPDDGLYLDERPARRDAAILLLADASGSTKNGINAEQRIIDVERDALLVVSEALAALGDRFAIYAFRGHGPQRVDLIPLKRFGDPASRDVRARIGGLQPNGYTRVGAAVRHATALLARESARHRLLLLFTDGRPNDIDQYEGPYGLEDTRQAFAEARVQGVHTFCLTVDFEAPVYAKRIFGTYGYAVVQDAARLPQHLVALVRRLIKR